MSRLAAACLVVALLASSLALAQDPIPDELKGSDRLVAVLDRVADAQARITTLQARFEQRRESHLLAAPSVSEGRFYFATPDSVLWEYRSPRSMRVLISDGAATTYRPEEKRAERVEIGRMQRRIFRFLGASEPLDQLRRYFAFTFRDRGPGRDYTLLLEPQTMQLKRRLQSVEVTIDRERFLPVGVTWVERDGDSTSYVFRDVVVNGPLDASLFRLEIPPDVEVVEVKLRGGRDTDE